MDLVGDRRGQSIQIGAILLFGVLIIAFSSYQAFVVPNQNRGVEYSHNQEVQSDMQDLRNAIVSVPGSTSSQAVSVELSTRYPTRLVARNPGSPSGSLRTNGTTAMRYNITVRNAAADGETGDVWNGTARPYNTGAIAYTPNYNVYDNAPTTYYGQSVAYNQFRTANLTLSEQSMINGRDITLVALNGSLSRNSGSTTSVDVRPVSRSDDPIIVSNDTATSNVSVSVPTRLPQSVWEELLADEIDDTPGDLSNDRYVADVTTTDGPGPYYNLTITFERGANYRLRMAKAGVGNSVSSESEAYLTDVRGDGSSVAADSTTEVVLEVRDEYNNPVQGVTVYGGVGPDSAGSLTDSEKVSGDDGQVTFEYDATGVTPDTQRLNFSYRGLDGEFDNGTMEDVSLTVTVNSQTGQNSDSSNSDSSASGASVYYNSSDSGGIRAVDSGGVTQYTGSAVQAAGLSRLVDINDGDSEPEVVYVSGNNNLLATDTNVKAEFINDSGGVKSGNVGIGDWDNDDNVEIVYIGNNNVVFQYDTNTTETSTVNRNNNDPITAQSIAGIGNFASDTSGLELVYVGTNNGKIAYISEQGGKRENTNTGPNNAKAVSQPGDFDGDDTAEVAIVTGSSTLQLVDSDGTEGSEFGQNVGEAPLGAVDWNDDPNPEIVYADSNNKDLYYYDLNDDTFTSITDSDGNIISTTSNAGTS